MLNLQRDYEYVGDEEGCEALIELNTGKLLAYVQHDGHGKYHPFAFVSPAAAFRIVRASDGWVRSMRCFPRIKVELFQQKCPGAARHMTQDALHGWRW